MRNENHETPLHSRFPGHDDTPPPSRPRSWGQPAVDEPIIDAARRMVEVEMVAMRGVVVGR